MAYLRILFFKFCIHLLIPQKMISFWDCIKGFHANISVRLIPFFLPAHVGISQDNWIRTVRGNIRIDFREALLKIDAIRLKVYKRLEISRDEQQKRVVKTECQLFIGPFQSFYLGQTHNTTNLVQCEEKNGIPFVHLCMLPAELISSSSHFDG